jgi:hypothetical protein
VNERSIRFFGVYEGSERLFGRKAAWTLVQLLRTGNGHTPLSGPPITGADVLHLYAALRKHLSADAAAYVIDSLRSGNGDVLPDGSAWPEGFRPRHESEVEQ